MTREYAESERYDARRYPDYTQPVSRSQVTGPRTNGWTVFSSVMLAMAGAFGLINGLIAVIHDEVYVVGESQLVALDFTQWGWVHIVLSSIVLLAACALATGTAWARVIGVVVAFVHALAQVAFIEAYPFWALSIIALDALVIYGCLVHSSDMETA